MGSTARRLAVLSSFVLVGCYHASIETGRAAGSQRIEKEWASGFLWGLVPPDPIAAPADLHRWRLKGGDTALVPERPGRRADARDLHADRHHRDLRREIAAGPLPRLRPTGIIVGPASSGSGP